MKIGDKIKKARLEKGLTQKELGKMMGVSQAMIGQYENGIRHPKAETISRISQALNISFEDIYDFDNLVVASHDEQTINVFLEDEIDKLLYYEISEINTKGKEKVLDYAKDIADNPKYKK